MMKSFLIDLEFPDNTKKVQTTSDVAQVTASWHLLIFSTIRQFKSTLPNYTVRKGPH